MKFKMISSFMILSIALVVALILGSCSNSNNNKTESTDQEATAKDSSENAVFDSQQPTSESTIDSESSEDSASEKEKEAENTANKKEAIPTVTKEVSTTKNDLNPSATSKTTTKSEINKQAETIKPAGTETSKAKTTVEQPKSDPVSPAVVKAETEEPKVTTQPQPVPEPEHAAENPKEVIVTQPAEEDTKVVQPAPGSWIVPAKDKNKPNPIKADAESLSIGKSLYKKHCISCHGKTGMGDGSKAAQLDTPSGDFTLPSFQNQTDGSLFYKTREGKGDMPEFKKKIPDEEDIWHIVNYIRTFK